MNLAEEMLIVLEVIVQLTRWIKRVLRALFRPPQDRFDRVVDWLGIVILFLIGIGLWLYLLDFGDFPLNFHDWAEGTGHRLAFLQQAVTNGQLPLHMPDGSALRNITDRFIAVPDTILSPQVIALRWLGLSQFVLFNTLLLYAVGFSGLVWFKRRYKLATAPFGIIFFLFSFNGHITDHIIVGHMHWAGYYLLPFFFGLVFQLFESERASTWSWIFRLSLVLGLMFLQGAFHLYVICLLALALILLAMPERWRLILGAGAFSILLSLFRILPPALEAGRFDSEFLDGFSSFTNLVEALISLKLPFKEYVFSQSPLQKLGWWEYDHFIGMAGLIFLLLTVWQIMKGAKSQDQDFRSILLPFGIMIMLAIGRIYRPINELGIPLLSSQRVSTRFLIIPVMGLTLLGGKYLQMYIDRISIQWRGQLGLLIFSAVLFHDLWQHIKLWRIRRMIELFDRREVVFSGEVIANHPDASYTLALVVGLMVSISSIIYILMRSSKERSSD